MYISYSGWKLYVQCPRAYFYRYTQKPLLPVAENKVNSVFGSATGMVFEQFYKEHLWRSADPVQELLSRAAPCLTLTLAKEREASAKLAKETGANEDEWRNSCIRWKSSDKKANYTSEEAVLKDMLKCIPRGIETIRRNKLIPKKVGAEVKLDTDFGPHRLGGRADFVLHNTWRGDGCTITDGKGSKYRDQYVDDAQLHWYAMLWRARTGETPDALAFVYWRSEADDGMDWIKFTAADLDHTLATALAAVEQVETGNLRFRVAKTENHRLDVVREHFPVHPGAGCGRCSYVAVCDAGQIMIKKSNSSVADDVLGVEDIEF